ncbi:hypothetical protein LY71_12112 [Geodermatophilus tzadiensis]|uniref:Treble clef zinc finger domain-containing protein n=1 Tax=Geodermatophilus tzadiensis TaxID=1137988 RepID=A0A2T0T144_9ACTN|nr:zinc-ribbon domain-containing protein [Geodermatophilus tzadiensis]PRY39343.1 hypothetical protein LY71_12112 [Geodermatophilus tzadiensis]
MATPFTPENIHQGDDDRWYHDGVDVTDRPVWFQCPEGHEYQFTLAEAVARRARCPECHPDQ